MRRVLLIVISSLKTLLFLMELVSFVTSAGLLFAIKEEKLIVEHLTTLLLRYWKENNTTCLWTCGVWEFWHMN